MIIMQQFNSSEELETSALPQIQGTFDQSTSVRLVARVTLKFQIRHVPRALVMLPSNREHEEAVGER